MQHSWSNAPFLRYRCVVHAILVGFMCIVRMSEVDLSVFKFPCRKSVTFTLAVTRCLCSIPYAFFYERQSGTRTTLSERLLCRHEPLAGGAGKCGLLAVVGRIVVRHSFINRQECQPAVAEMRVCTSARHRRRPRSKLPTRMLPRLQSPTPSRRVA